MKARRLRLGMVGGGQGAFIGAVHRIAARLDDEYELVAGAFSSQPKRALVSGQELGLAADRCYADYAEMARSEAAREDGIDVVAIVTPNYLHAPVAACFLKAGIHVICDKPLAISRAEGEELASLARERGLVFVVTHAYAGYPLVRHAREMVASGQLGDLRLVQVEYVQDWLADAVAADPGFLDENWHNDPRRAGPTGCLGDIGTHAYHLAGYVSGMQPESVSAELHTFTTGRRVDDHAQMMLRYANGARGILFASQVAAGAENALRLRLYGTKGSLAFEQESPNELWFTPQGGHAQRITRGRVNSTDAVQATRIPPGHPEGFLESFAQLYRDAAFRIRAGSTHSGGAPNGLLPTVEDGLAGLCFIDAVLESHQSDGRWTPIAVMPSGTRKVN